MKNLKQSTWETWFIISVILLLSFLFVGTLPGSVQTFPNFCYGAIPVTINFLVCIFIGSQSSND